MSLRKRKFSNTNLSRSTGSKTRSGSANAATSSPLPPAPPVPPQQSPPLNELYQNFVLSVVDQSALSAPEIVERPPPTGFSTILQSTRVGTENGNKSTSAQANNPIPLPPPLPESNLKAAGILAELITLRGSHLASTDNAKGRKNDSSSQNLTNRPSLLERFPPKFSGNSSISPNSNIQASGGLAVKGETLAKKSAARSEEDESKLLLSSLDKTNPSENEKQQRENEDAERSHFVQELLLSMLAADYGSQRSAAREKASPVVFLSEKNQSSNNNATGVVSSIVSNRKSKAENIKESEHVRPSPESSQNVNTVVEIDTLAQAVQSVGISGDLDLETQTSNQQYDRNLLSLPRPPAGVRRNNFEHSQPYHYDFDDEKDSDDNKPTSPRQHNIRMQDLVYQQGAVRLAGVSNSARISSYGRDDLTSDVVGKHVQ